MYCLLIIICRWHCSGRGSQGSSPVARPTPSKLGSTNRHNPTVPLPPATLPPSTASCDKSTQPHNTASPLLPPLAPGREQLVPFIVMQRHMQLPPFFYAASVLVRIATLVAMRPGSPLQGTARQAPTQLAPPRCRYQGSIARLSVRGSGYRPSGISPKYNQSEWAT